MFLSLHQSKGQGLAMQTPSPNSKGQGKVVQMVMQNHPIFLATHGHTLTSVYKNILLGTCETKTTFGD